MWQEIFSLATTNGIFASLFVFLFFYQLSDSKKREEKYQATIIQLGGQLDCVLEIRDDIKKVQKIMVSHLNTKQENYEGKI
ncbi:MAG: BhlA/UviB family holin-like peptide [Clostridia bacterium]